MNRERVVPEIGAAACLAVVLLVLLPYLVVDATGLGVYYDAGPVGPPVLALLAGVAAVALLAAARGRSDPATVAGLALVVGLVTTVLALLWALAVTPDVVGGLSELAALEYHRWAVVAACAAVTASAGWYARLVL